MVSSTTHVSLHRSNRDDEKQASQFGSFKMMFETFSHYNEQVSGHFLS